MIHNARHFAAFCALLTLVWWLQPEVASYQRPLITAGEWWRIVTGQFVHWSLPHLFGNLLGLGVAWLLFAQHWHGWCFWVLAVVVAAGTNLSLWLFSPEVAYYVGFSGALYGLITYGAVRDWLAGIRFGWLISLGVVAKVSYEFFVAPMPWFSTDTSTLAVDAHFYGAMLGGVSGLLVAAFKGRH
ncbi:MAG: rhombosortase [Firmicutes bacterium]|nr:rhombosortase [Bacillota bacterium]